MSDFIIETIELNIDIKWDMAVWCDDTLGYWTYPKTDEYGRYFIRCKNEEDRVLFILKWHEYILGPYQASHPTN
jgi:hypothetical protein